MADNDNKELMQFLEKKFDGIEKQFESVTKEFKEVHKRLDNTPTKDDLAAVRDELTNFATKDDLKTEIATAKEETMRHTGVLIEAVEHKLDIVIEGLMGANERLDRRTDENEQEHNRLEKMSLINTADISKLDQRVGKLEGRV